MAIWAGIDDDLGKVVRQQSNACLDTYRADPKRVTEDHRGERRTAESGYATKQLFELIQNASDAMVGSSGAIEVLLTSDTLYVANEGEPFQRAGVEGLMAAHLSEKNEDRIGRYGLGFKSVVMISDTPQVFSRSGSFGFDAAWSAGQIAAIAPNPEGYPILRLARSLDPANAAAQDPHLADLMERATTVVRIPLKSGRERLSDDLEKFPGRFLLFAPHVEQITMRDSELGTTRRHRVVRKSSNVVELISGDSTQRWAVVTRHHSLTTAQIHDIGALKKSSTVPVSLAVPIGATLQMGEFWAHFPTKEKTTLRGIVNTAWNLSPDREHLLDGAYNREIIEEQVPALLSDLLPTLAEQEDVASIVDVYPSRALEREAPSWADVALNIPVYSLLAKVPSLPDTRGKLRLPSKLRLPPEVSKEALLAWGQKTPQPEGWLHTDVILKSAPTRKSKAVRLIASANHSTVPAWLEALVADASMEGSAVAVDVLRQLSGESREEGRKARVVKLEDGSNARPVPGRVFLRSTAKDSGHAFVHPALTELPSVVESLRQLGITVLDKAGELRNALVGRPPSSIEWSKVWPLARATDPDVALHILRTELRDPIELSVHVRNAEHKFVPLARVLLPGSVVTANTDPRWCIDLAYHGQDQRLLAQLGAVSVPTFQAHGSKPLEPWLDAELDRVKDAYAKQLGNPRLDMSNAEFETPVAPWPLEMFPELSVTARVALTEHLLAHLDSGAWKIRHPKHGRMQFPNPVANRIKHHGVLRTTVGPFPVTECLTDSGDAEPDVMPVADVSTSNAEWLGLGAGRAELKESAWRRLLSYAQRWDSEHERRERLYAWAAYSRVSAPETVRAPRGSVFVESPTKDTAVAIDSEDVRSLLDQQFAVIQVKEEVDLDHLVDAWAMEDGRALLDQLFQFEPRGSAEPIEDLFPALTRHHPHTNEWTIQQCSSMSLEVLTHSGMRSRSITRRFENGVIYTTAVDPASVLKDASDLGHLELTREDINAILEDKHSAEVQAWIERILAARTVEEKIAKLVSDDELRKFVPELALETIRKQTGTRPCGAALAKLFLSVHGVGAFRVLRPHLADLDPPTRWVGGFRAREFVTSLGFPVEFAGRPRIEREAMISIDGPTKLPDAHDYQEDVMEKIEELLDRSEKSRGLVALPTGAGKTRVSVEAVIRKMSKAHDADEPYLVVWVAQTDELCEQAVETWSYVWRAIGPDSPLAIGRMWDGNRVEEGGGINVVVATRNTLSDKASENDPNDGWLKEADLVIIDEAHTSVAATYGDILKWFGYEIGRRYNGSGRPLLGLSATPFRNTNETESMKLAELYGSNRIVPAQFENRTPHEFLQTKGILAQVDHDVLPGSEITLSASEQVHFRDFRRLHPQVEERLGQDVERNQRIVESIEGLDDKATVLLFATSVEHARVLASLLSYRGIVAAAISGDTDRTVRRQAISDFRSGKIRVITNYGVLAQGFDAPKVEAVYITRPTFSQNLYQQMVGRGLRGPANGGSERVLIVNVADNINLHGEELAFHHFDHLWETDE